MTDFQMFLVFFLYFHDCLTIFLPVLLSIFAHFSGCPFGFQCFSTHAPATDRYLARGLSKSVCVYNRKNREICLSSRAKSGKTLVEAAAKWRKTNRTIWLLLSSETVFHRIGPLFHRIGPRVSQRRTFSKTNAPNLKKHPVYEPPRSPRKVAGKPAWHEGRKDTASVERESIQRPFQQARGDLLR